MYCITIILQRPMETLPPTIMRLDTSELCSHLLNVHLQKSQVYDQVSSVKISFFILINSRKDIIEEHKKANKECYDPLTANGVPIPKSPSTWNLF